MTDCIIFWQRMLTPHMTELAQQLARAGAEVHYVTEEALSEERRAMGWKADEPNEVVSHFMTLAEDARSLVDHLPAHAVHITQGVRANGLVAHAQKRITERGLRHYPIMEKVDLRGLAGLLKPIIYRLRFRAFASRIEGLLAIGESTPKWIEKRSPATMRTIPFAYFLGSRRQPPPNRDSCKFKFIFVGALIELKRVDLLLKALSGLADRAFEVEIVGDGPERPQLERQAVEILPGRVTFLGTLGMDAAIDRIAAADCLVLPSDHDGWGAVVSEAQINGTPAVCSSECGASGTVRAGGFDAVFEAGDVYSLRRCLADRLDEGRITDTRREKLGAWARCLTGEAGANYLLEIIRRDSEIEGCIIPPWERARP